MIINSILTIISLIAEYCTMLYYCNSVMDYKHSKCSSIFIVTVGYVLYCVICLFGNIGLNICGFVIINTLIMILGYNNSTGRILFKVVIMTGLMMFGELLASLLIHTEINNETLSIITIAEDAIFAFTSKFLYIITMLIFRHLSVNRSQRYQTREMLYLVVLPVSTCLFLYLFNQISCILSNRLEILFVIFSILLIIANFISYFVCEKIIDNSMQSEKLKQIEFKKEINEKSYRLIQEKYNELKILVHDFEKYCNYIDERISTGHEDVQALTKKIKDKNKEFLIVEYTDNKALNILLSQKIKECNNNNIDFQIYSQGISLTFIEESDVIAIFGNLIDNAIESCMISDRKKIFMQIHTMNDKLLVINLENSADNEPIVKNDKLRTFKNDKQNHGIGLTSVKQALEHYNGHLQWEYKSDKHTFITTILISLQVISPKK